MDTVAHYQQAVREMRAARKRVRSIEETVREFLRFVNGQENSFDITTWPSAAEVAAALAKNESTLFQAGQAWQAVEESDRICLHNPSEVY